MCVYVYVYVCMCSCVCVCMRRASVCESSFVLSQQQSASVLNTFNTEAMKLNSIGVTLTTISGDNGVANSNCGCSDNSGSSASLWSGVGTWTGTGYFPSFPGTSPWVLTVGATMGPGGLPPAVGSPEIVCQSQLGGVITSGGGFSTFFPQPAYQTSAVSSYFAGLTTQPASGYNKNGRAIPDMAMLGVAYQVMVGGSLVSLCGTSCSSPVFAAFISLINAARQAKGMGSIGFINPTLYANATFFNDVVSGYNNCCSYSASTNSSLATCCSAGFNATAGWDPLTGLGSLTYPNFASMFGV